MAKPKKQLRKSLFSKATSHSSNPPKEKHARAIITLTQTGDTLIIDEVIAGLARRLEKDTWQTVLKALMIFHRCFREGGSAFIEALKHRSHAIFALKRFRANNHQAQIYIRFVIKYAKYLEEQVSVLRLLGFQFENKRDCCKKLTLPYSFKIVPKLQSQLNALLNCKMRHQHIGKSDLVISSFMLLLKDSFILYPILNDGVINLIDTCFSMKKNEVEKVLEIYSLFVRETEALISLYSNMRTFVAHIPEIKRAKTSLIDVLKNRIETMDDNGEVGEIPSSHEEIDHPFSGQSFQKSFEDYSDDSDSSDSEDSSSSSSDSVKVSRVGSHIEPKDSWMNLASQPQQHRSTTSQGWDIFDHSNTESSFQSDPFGKSLDFDGGFNTSYSGSTDFPTDTGNSFSNIPQYQQPPQQYQQDLPQQYQQDLPQQYQDPSQQFYQSPPQERNNHTEIPYEQRADNVKSLVEKLYGSHITPTTANENPFLQDEDEPKEPVNPFLNETTQNPFETKQEKKDVPSNETYNPFL